MDGTRLKAVNSRKRNFTQQKLAGWIKLADERIEEYLGRLDRADRAEIEAQGAARRSATLEAKLARVRTRRELHQAMLTELVASGESQLSLTDPDAIKQWMNQGAFLMRGLANVNAEFSLTALAYNLRRAINILGIPALLRAVQA